MKSHFWKTIVGILLFITIILLVWFVTDFTELYRTGKLRSNRGFHQNYTAGEVLSPDQIQSWMTFAYVTYIFHLPPKYLLQSLSVSDNQYPNIQISRYAKNNNLDIDTFLKQVQQSISNYQTVPQ